MNFTSYPRHWLRLHIIVNRSLIYVSAYVGWHYRMRRFHFSRARAA